MNNKNRLRFYWNLLANKRRILTDTYDGKLQLAVVEFLWTTRSLFGLSIYSTLFIFKDSFKTKNGNFVIHKDLQSAITISPAFEADDIEELLKLVSTHVKKKEKILFIDVGAHVGVYSIAIGRKFSKYNKLDIIAFEPDANNFYKDNSSLLTSNIKLNKVKNFKLYKIGLGNKDTTKPNRFGFITKKLDSVLNNKVAKKYDVIFMKIDIEGYEEDALEGSKAFIKNSKNLYLLIEDCVGKNIFKYMNKNFHFYKKISPYNSFWTK